jgi:hypothetical protein
VSLRQEDVIVDDAVREGDGRGKLLVDYREEVEGKQPEFLAGTITMWARAHV